MSFGFWKTMNEIYYPCLIASLQSWSVGSDFLNDSISYFLKKWTSIKDELYISFSRWNKVWFNFNIGHYQKFSIRSTRNEELFCVANTIPTAQWPRASYKPNAEPDTNCAVPSKSLLIQCFLKIILALPLKKNQAYYPW